MMGNLQNYKPVPDGYEPRKGDIVLVEMLAYNDEPENDLWSNDEGHYFRASCVVAAKKNPIEAGCKVNVIHRDRLDAHTAEVIAVDRKYAFVLITFTSGEWHHEVIGLHELERINA